MSTRSRFLNVATMAVLCLVAFIPLASAYRSLDFWIAALGSLLVGTAIAVLAARLRWQTLTVFAAVIIAYFAFGGVLVFRSESLLGFIPTPRVLSSLALGSVQVWKQALTLQTPFIGFDELLVAPYFLGLITSVLAVTFALRLRQFAWALLPIAALFTFAVLYSAFNATAPGFVGAALAGAALLWLVWRIRAARMAANLATLDDTGSISPQQSRGLSARSAATVAAVTIGAVALSGIGASALPLDRFTLRDHVIPPLEMHDFASPLTSFRKWVTDGADANLFVVRDLPEGAAIRLAGLDFYDGIVYRVSGAGGAGSGQFNRVGRELEPTIEGTPARVSVEIGDLGSVWLPTAGSLTSLQLETPEAISRTADLYYNPETSTAVLTSGLLPGDTYVFDTVVQSRPDEQTLTNAKVAQVQTPKPEQVPDQILAALDEIVSQTTNPTEQVRAVEAYLQTTGFFSHGLEGEAVSRAGHGAGREAELFSAPQMIGDDEQYSVAMALMLSQLGIPSRVVLGFTGESGGSLGAEGTINITGEQVHAWVEVPFEGIGWVSFWPTPAEDRIPLEQVPEQRQKPRAQVAQPPDTPQEPAELPPAPPVEDAEQEEEESTDSLLHLVLTITGISALILALLLGPPLLFAVVKSRRRKKRATSVTPADRVSGGWAELVDAATDVGAPVLAGATRREQARELDAQFPEAGASPLAVRADAAVFGDGTPSPEAIDGFWRDAAQTQQKIRKAQPLRKRLRARMYPPSVTQAIGKRIRSLGRKKRGSL